MNTLSSVLAAYDAADIPAFAADSLRAACGRMPEDDFRGAVRDAVDAGELLWLCDEVLARPNSKCPHKGDWAIVALLRGHYGYVSYETVLSEWGVISQVPFCVTLATTGESREVRTKWGRLDFTHTPRPVRTIYRNTQKRLDSPLRYAYPNRALGDLHHEGRCLDLVDMDDYADVMAELRRVVPHLGEAD